MAPMRAQRLENEKRKMMTGIDELIDKKMVLPLNEEWAYVLTPEGKGFGIRVYLTNEWTAQEAKNIRITLATKYAKNRESFRRHRYSQ